MILKALCNLAEEQHRALVEGDLRGNLAFEERRVDFHIVLHDDESRTLVSHWEDVASPRGPRREVKREFVPLQHKRSGTAPEAHFLVDNAKFVFGVSLNPEADDRAESDIRPKSFREKVEGLFADLPRGSEEAHAVGVLLGFLHAPALERRAVLHEACDRAGKNLESYVARSAQFAFEVRSTLANTYSPPARSGCRLASTAGEDGADIRPLCRYRPTRACRRRPSERQGCSRRDRGRGDAGQLQPASILVVRALPE